MSGQAGIGFNTICRQTSCSFLRATAGRPGKPESERFSWTSSVRAVEAAWRERTILGNLHYSGQSGEQRIVRGRMARSGYCPEPASHEPLPRVDLPDELASVLRGLNRREHPTLPSWQTIVATFSHRAECRPGCVARASCVQAHPESGFRRPGFVFWNLLPNG